MFEDIDDQKSPIEISRDAGDRAVVYAIWTRSAGGRLAVDEAWGVLHARYPDEARFLLLHAYEELLGERSDAWSPSKFLAKVRQVLDTAGGRLNPEARDLLAVAADDLHPLSEEDAGRLERLRSRVGMRAGDADAARKRLQRLASDVVRELHDRTAGGKSIGRTSGHGPAAAPASDWKTAIAAATGARASYSATAKVSAGDVVEHPKFGAGVVISVEPGRANILFESGARKLVAG
ncbi:MAG: hypothetical protein KF795_19510 [Labilithrix sp.]|nr:hypothetical protein [Labilithrix sp.]MBX3222717.1 hypothetical protein [Labilithrix sp.]